MKKRHTLNAIENITDRIQNSLKGEIKQLGETTIEDWRKEYIRNWTRKLINNIVIFIKNKKLIDHYTMQMFIGHGTFNTYRIRINKEINNQCWNCNEEFNDAEQILFKCPRWASQHIAHENHAGESLSAKNMITLVTADNDIWNHFQVFCGSIMNFL